MAYLSVGDYILKFGAYEARLFTNLDPENQLPDDRPDTARIEGAISDAEEEVEGYIARRYAVPLAAPISKLVVGWVAAIARLKLAEGTGSVSGVIKDAADRVTRQLEQLVADKLDLPVDAGVAAPSPAAAGLAVSSGDRDRPTFSDGLGGFMAPFTGGDGYAPCWRRGG